MTITYFRIAHSYIPIQSDYSDLVDAAAYFIGAPDGSGSHDKVAKRIAQQGKKWSDEHWREVDMTAYLFRLCGSLLSCRVRACTCDCECHCH